MTHETDVLVVGGGATGCGVARDLALRGVDVTLAERGSLGGGTTGRSHGLLHSGARYAVDDPEGARECIAENRVLRDIGGACVDETGGYVVQLPGDDAAHFEAKLSACRDLGIEADPVGGDGLREAEPSVAADAERAFRVPDAVVYPSRLVAANAADARDHGARVLTGAPVTDFAVREGRVAGAALDHPVGRVDARHVVNAAGAWAGELAALAGLDVEMRPTRGAMVVVEHDGLGAVLNRARPASDGDIAVPHGRTVVLGTTSVPVEDPDDYPREGAEVDRVFEECAAMLADVSRDRIVRTYWGVRPLYSPESAGGRAISRGFYLLDHAARDDRPGLTTVVGGKLTTYRLMAEAVADHVCARLGVDEPGRTADRPLPGGDDPATLDGFVEEFGVDSPADADVVGATSS